MPKISELPLANKLKEEDYIPIVQDGVTKKVKGTHFVTEEEYSLDAFSPTIAANDKAMYKFGEGDTVDFSDSAYDGAYKSAILKGQTLVNLCPNKVINYTAANDWDGFNALGQSSTTKERWRALQDLKPNTKYFVSCYVETFNVSEGQCYFLNNNSHLTVFPNYLEIRATGLHKWVLTSKPEFTEDISLALRCQNKNARGAIKIRDIMIIEYQEGMENWDIPYFEGMQSVRMPVLTTTGKNLFDGKFELGTINSTNGIFTSVTTAIRAKNYTEVKGNTDYVMYIGSDYTMAVACYDENKQFLRTLGAYATSYVFHLAEDVKYVKLRTPDGKGMNDVNVEVSLYEYEKEMDVSYHPYKSNILSTSEEVVLRSLPNGIKDTLNCITGEYVQHIKEVVLDGSYDENVAMAYVDDTTLVRFNINNVAGVQFGSVNKVLCSSLPYLFIHDLSGGSATVSQECISNHSQVENMITIIIKRSRLSSVDEEGFRAYLQSNPITIQYSIATPVVKTVDLLGTPFGYKGGHIIKSSADGSLLPKFEYEVAVSRGAQISQNTSTLIKHDEKITELLKKTAATYINQKAEIAYLLNMSSTLEEVQTIPFIEDDYVNDDCMVDSDMVMDDMEVEPEKEIIDNADTLLINLIYDLIELNDTLGLSEKVELFRQSGLIDKHNYEIIKEKLNPTFKEEDYAGINQ